jgi:hypothetical protein
MPCTLRCAIALVGHWHFELCTRHMPLTSLFQAPKRFLLYRQQNLSLSGESPASPIFKGSLFCTDEQYRRGRQPPERFKIYCRIYKILLLVQIRIRWDGGHLVVALVALANGVAVLPNDGRISGANFPHA